MADLTNRLAGTAFISVDGKTYQLEGMLAYSPVAVKRETLTGQDGVHGYKELPTPGIIKGDFRDSGGLRVEDFNEMTDVNIVARLANGKTIVGSNMWTVESQEVDTVDAKFSVEWQGIEGCVTEEGVG